MWPPGIAYKMIIHRCYRLLFSIHILCENTSLLPPTLLQPKLIGPCAPSFHSVDVIFSRVLYDFFLCLPNGACIPRRLYLFQKTQSVIAAPLIISHIVWLSRDPPYLYKIVIAGNDSINKRENNNRLNCNKLPLLARLILVAALFHVLGACRLTNNSTPHQLLFLCCWLPGYNSAVSIKDILCLSSGE